MRVSNQQTLTVLMKRREEVLLRITGLFVRRSLEIESLKLECKVTPNDGVLWHMTVTARAEEREWKQLILRLLKLIDVLSVNGSGLGAALNRKAE
ncbi:ACT domain-containing protein [Paenibacillus beijingensis]|uniref:ACT domain-containing protein n=1 Tax=Paenibacillus beijingensis TaxID=1126833 RepID=A0A0D5NL77_9BACL|nr:ACT domain-containing protein [Paenibacillus beijingensis]AJY76021.1 hypothetical protein VN24_17490 [Paenibacillus beijingensis]